MRNEENAAPSSLQHLNWRVTLLLTRRTHQFSDLGGEIFCSGLLFKHRCHRQSENHNCQLQKTNFTAKVSVFLPHYSHPAGQTPTLQAPMSQTRSFKWDSTQNECLPPLDNPANCGSELVRLKRFQNYNKCSTWSSADQKHSGSQMGSVKCHFCSERCLIRSSVESPLTPEQIWAAESGVQL